MVFTLSSIIVLLIGALIAPFVSNRIVRIPLLSFVFVWFFILALSSLELNGFYGVSPYALLLVGAHIFFFIFGYLAGAPFTATKKQRNYINNGSAITSVYSGNVLPIIATLGCIPLAFLAYKYLTFVSVNSIDARSVRFEVGDLFSTTTGAVLYNYFAGAYFDIFLCIFIYGIFSKKIRLKLFIPCLIGLASYFAIGFGRLVFIQTLITLLAVLLLTRKRTSKKRIFFLTVLLLLFFAFLLVMVTALRRGERVTPSNVFSIFSNTIQETLTQVYIYAVGPIRAFDFSIHNYVDVLHFNFGRMTGCGVDEIVSYLLTKSGIYVESMNDIYGTLLQADVPVGENTTVIALFTALFHFYFDFGIVGIILFSFCFGRIICFLSKYLSSHSSSLPVFIIYLYSLYAIVMLPIKWAYASPSTVFVLLALLIWESIRKANIRTSKARIRSLGASMFIGKH